MNTELTNQEDFFILLLSLYAKHKNTSDKFILTLWNKLGIVENINDYYDYFHIERIENAFETIDNIIKEKFNSIEDSNKFINEIYMEIGEEEKNFTI